LGSGEEDWTAGGLDGVSVLGWQVLHDLEVEGVEFGDRRQRDVRRGSTRLTVDDEPLTMDDLHVGTLSDWRVEEWKVGKPKRLKVETFAGLNIWQGADIV
jgi:hypothetical protein